eukprot:CAMPEP_0176066638 /NCGR_PEP_ID=MMETSP0120_2-20121206/33257_1 /TAXON_ID=160619 /ORGANISM="Kryptoperidinium foliaceum, Strain CCMP 1326" /LENGTH=429 /DNA_ID=CAMNT_0017400247 /DNA_START=16 /DNA_END=1302 /DNA_ORIENTATION=-
MTTPSFAGALIPADAPWYGGAVHTASASIWSPLAQPWNQQSPHQFSGAGGQDLRHLQLSPSFSGSSCPDQQGQPMYGMLGGQGLPAQHYGATGDHQPHYANMRGQDLSQYSLASTGVIDLREPQHGSMTRERRPSDVRHLQPSMRYGGREQLPPSQLGHSGEQYMGSTGSQESQLQQLPPHYVVAQCQGAGALAGPPGDYASMAEDVAAPRSGAYGGLALQKAHLGLPMGPPPASLPVGLSMLRLCDAEPRRCSSQANVAMEKASPSSSTDGVSSPASQAESSGPPSGDGSPGAWPSIGSMGHATRNCRPCAFTRASMGCKFGEQCNFCHMTADHPEVVRARPCKGKRERMKRMMASIKERVSENPDLFANGGIVLPAFVEANPRSRAAAMSQLAQVAADAYLGRAGLSAQVAANMARDEDDEDEEQEG